MSDRATLARLQVGTSVRAEAVRRGVKQREIGVKLGVSQSSVSGRLNGRVSFTAEELIALADWFCVPIGRFFEPAPELPEGAAS